MNTLSDSDLADLEVLAAAEGIRAALLRAQDLLARRTGRQDLLDPGESLFAARVPKAAARSSPSCWPGSQRPNSRRSNPSKDKRERHVATWRAIAKSPACQGPR